MTDQTNKNGFTRRGLLGTTAAVTAAGATGIVGGMGLSRSQAQSASSPHAKTEVAPGELDEYYVFSSSGQCGEVRILASRPCAS